MTDILKVGSEHEAYTKLRDLLVQGFFAPDEHLTEARLTDLLGVSRGTIRPVLVRLAQEGYVTREANRGVRTRSFTVDEAIEVLEAREVLESALAGLAAGRATDEDLARLHQIFEQMDQAEGADRREEYSALNRQFHAQIRRAAHQETLSGFVDNLVYPMVMRQYRDLRRSRPRDQSLREHRAILSTIEAGSPEAAATAMRHHVSSARRGLVIQ